METASKIWMDGRLIPWNKAKIHVLTHTLHYGGGAFEGIRFYDTTKGPAIFRLKEHVDRFFYSALSVGMELPYSKKVITDAIIRLIRVTKLKSGYIRPIAFYGYGKMGLDPRGCKINVVIAAWPWGAYLGTKPVKAGISKFIRIHPRSTISDAKLCGHYVNSILASLDVHKKGYDEAIMLDHKGNIAEGPGENIFIVKKGLLLTPKTGSILPGITRQSIMAIAREEGISVRMTIISKKMLREADEAFYSGTAAEISAIASVDKKKIGTGRIGPITGKLKNRFTKIISGNDKEHLAWLTFVLPQKKPRK